ncbi:hypothetical protein [Microbulbifer rhizosphaerae]|uniref:TnsA endonuclease C terminal n=1 Tax=Microbulbifer rhizosphaerae TaxID=1562603 RepID=A0A7W4Z7Z8_9GAMM|nr:hypothetical protein [Microbulbifer rhizosphaerae]MBB3060057.1 hypothetical protein [Microbulbifer rhizosphaerae]
MVPNGLQGTPEILADVTKVKGTSLIPNQQPTKVDILKRADCYQQYCLKFDDVAVLHSYPMYLHTLLLESDPDVISFVPRPYRLRVGRRDYVPACYVARTGGRDVIDISPHGEMAEALQRPLAAYFDWHDLTFSVVSEESLLEQETLALNWLPLIQVLVAARQLGLETTELECRLLHEIVAGSASEVGDLLQPGRREEQFLEEVALYRLIHQRRVAVDLSRAPLDFDTVVTPWHSLGASD